MQLAASRIPSDLTEAEWLEIEAALRCGRSQAEIAEAFGLNPKSLWRVLRQRQIGYTKAVHSGGYCDGPSANPRCLHRPKAVAALPGVRRTREQVEAMRARQVPEEAIARALGQVPQNLSCGDPFGTDPRTRRGA